MLCRSVLEVKVARVLAGKFVSGALIGQSLRKMSDWPVHVAGSDGGPAHDDSALSNGSFATVRSDEGDQSLEEISHRLINSFIMEKCDLEQQYAEMIKLKNSNETHLQNLGFTYPEDSDTDSLEQLKQHDIRLSQTKDALLAQQTRLKRALQNLRKIKKGVTCNNCRMNANKKMCQTGTQFDSDESFREHGSTQTSLPVTGLSGEKCPNSTDNSEQDNNICPLCGTFYGKTTSFAEFHEHVLSHFTKEVSIDGFEVVH